MARGPAATKRRRVVGKRGPGAYSAAEAQAVVDAMLTTSEAGSGRSNTWRALWLVLMVGATADLQVVQDSG
jgi:hypothetical protein